MWWEPSHDSLLRAGYRKGYTASYIATLIPHTPEAIRARASRKGIRYRHNYAPIPHGTASGYGYHGCRCVECKLASSSRANRARHRNAAEGREPRKHGTPSGYNYFGCRCRPCTDAHLVYNRPYVRAYEKRKKEAAA